MKELHKTLLILFVFVKKRRKKIGRFIKSLKLKSNSGVKEAEILYSKEKTVGASD